MLQQGLTYFSLYSKPANMKNPILKTPINLNNKWVWLATILLITIVVYFPTFQFELLNYDDERLIIKNKLIKDFSFYSLQLYFADYYDNIYQPFVLMSWAFDYAIDGLNPSVFHIHNLVLHLINISLVFFFIQLLFNDKRISIITAFLFAIQALHIESVAWISERKDLVYSMYFLLSLIMYIKYIKTSQLKFYALSIVLFLFSLFSKGLAIALAPTIFAIDFFYRRKILSKKVILEKIPFLILATIFAIIGSIGFFIHNKPSDISIVGKILSTGFVFFNYFTKVIFPYKLSAFHPYPEEIGGYYSIKFIILTILSVLAIVALFLLARKSRKLAFGALFFIVNILLALKLSQITNLGFIMADRYTYISSIGIFIIVATFFIHLLKRFSRFKIPVLAILFAYMFFHTAISSQHIFVWQDSISIWDSIVEQYPDRSRFYNKRGMAKVDNGDFKGSIQDFSEAVNINPNYEKAYYCRADAYEKLKKWKMAIQDYSKIIDSDVNSSKAYSLRGKVYEKTSNYNKALIDFNTAIEIDPNHPKLYVQRAYFFYKTGDYQAAIQDYDIALEIKPKMKIAKRQREMVLRKYREKSFF